MAYGDFEYLARRAASDKVLRGKAFDIAKNPKYDGYQRGLASMVYKFFDKRFALLSDESVAGSCINMNVNIDKLAEELANHLIKKNKNKKTGLFRI